MDPYQWTAVVVGSLCIALVTIALRQAPLASVLPSPRLTHHEQSVSTSPRARLKNDLLLPPKRRYGILPNPLHEKALDALCQVQIPRRAIVVDAWK